MRTIPLHGKKAAGRVALVDDEDYGLVMQYRWFAYDPDPKPGRRRQGPYATANIIISGRHTTMRMHCLIMGVTGVDHRDHDGLNNQRSNLRLATPRRNQHNARARLHGTSRFKGVSWNRDTGKWAAQIKISGQSRRLGQFSDEEAAARAYDAAALAAWGEFAHLNFPEKVA